MPTDTPDLGDAIGRATGYVKAGLASGDYSLSCVGGRTESTWPDGKGHLFAGFFAAEALADDLADSERTLLTERIRSESRNGLYSYAPDAHPGAISSDDTAFVLRCCRRLGLEESPGRLLQFYKETGAVCGGFTTFLNLIPSQPRLAFEQSPDDHRQFHPEVNANVFLLLRDTPLAGYIDRDLIVKSQAPEGYWHSYCYPSRYYATSLFIELIRDDPELAGALERGLAFLLGSQNGDGSWGTPGEPYETALAANALALCGRHSGALMKGIAFLLDRQDDDGSWSTPNVIWEWLEQEGDRWEAFDSNRIVATSLSLLALKRVLGVLGSSGS